MPGIHIDPTPRALALAVFAAALTGCHAVPASPPAPVGVASVPTSATSEAEPETEPETERTDAPPNSEPPGRPETPNAASRAFQPRPPPSDDRGLGSLLLEPPGGDRAPDPNGPDALDVAQSERLARETIDPEASDDVLTVQTSVIRDALPAEDRAMTLDELDDQIVGDQVALEGAYLDSARTRFLAAVRYGPVATLYLVLSPNGKPLLRLRVDQRNMPHLRDVAGDAELELIVSVIHGQALSTYPRSWHVYDLSGSKARRIAEIPHSFSQGAKYLDWGFLNVITFPAHEKIRVETRFMAEDLDPQLRARFPPHAPTVAGETVEYVYSARRRRFFAHTIDTAKAPPTAPADDDASER